MTGTRTKGLGLRVRHPSLRTGGRLGRIQRERGENLHHPSARRSKKTCADIHFLSHWWRKTSRFIRPSVNSQIRSQSGTLHSFAFVQGTGDTHNHLFFITSSGLLKTSVSLDYEAMQTLSIRSALDPYGKSIDANFNVSILDLADDPLANPPTVENNQTHSPANPTPPPRNLPIRTQAYLPNVTPNHRRSTDDLLGSGTVQADGGSPIREAGFVVSRALPSGKHPPARSTGHKFEAILRHRTSRTVRTGQGLLFPGLCPQCSG